MSLEVTRRFLSSARNRACLAAGLIAGATLLAWGASTRMSITIDEFQALPSGIAMLETGDLRYPKGTPPLSQLLPALPEWLAGTRIGPATGDTSLTSWGLAHVFADQQKEQLPRRFASARLVSAAVFLAMLCLLFGYARSLYGESAALLSLFVAGLCPNLLGHGALVTPDIYLAAAVLATLWAADSLATSSRAGTALALGASLGVAATAKFTGLLLFPLVPFLARGARARHLLLALAAGWLVIHLVYAFGGSFSPLSAFAFESSFFRRLQAHLPGGLPVPLPFHFLRALDEQLAEHSYPAYLLGELNTDGFYSFYLVALLVKTPLATMLLAAMALHAHPRLEKRERAYVLLGAGLLIFFSLERFKNIGVRYLLFLFPLMALWCGRILVYRRRVGPALVLLALLLTESLAAWPDSLAFFNLASGGTVGGHRILLDSNLDWGQGLLELRDYLARTGVPRVSLAYAGRVRPEYYGIHYVTLHAGEAPSEPVVVISANLLWGRGYFVNGTGYWPRDRDAYAAYRERAPLAILGGSLYVYSRPEVAAMR